MQTKEIGSEFHYCFEEKGALSQNILNFKDSVFVFSGRTAIETILKNIPAVKKALLPSYCCASMIEPFLRAGISVDFYEVFYDDELEINLDIPKKVDVLLWCNYFGFRCKMPDLSQFLNNGGIIIEDITHSFLSDQSHSSQSQYMVASLRKWFPVLSGGLCATTGNVLKYKPIKDVSDCFLESKKKAMLQKSEYLEKADVNLKRIFSENFSVSNKWLADNYSDLKIDVESIEILKHIDFAKVRKARRENASSIYDFLNQQKKIKPLFKQENMDCPLFVPIVFRSSAERDSIRKKLIEANIYCPVHWPKPYNGCFSNLYDLELSLICDQRYGEEEMKRQISVIAELYE